MTGRLPKETLYTLPNGIEVVGEYPPNSKCPYWRLRVRPHPLINGKISSGGVYAKRSRVVVAAYLGRQINPNEHVHHKNEDRSDDRIDNLEVLSPSKHNDHHKRGSKHTEQSKRKISAGLKKAIKEGRREPPPGADWRGRKHSEKSRRKISESRKAGIESGTIKKSIPPNMKGKKLKPMTETHKQKIRTARIEYFKKRREEKC